jgi:predicted nuclease with TOPRIM domain
MTSQASADVQESKEAIKDLQAQMAELEQERDQALEEVNRKWSEIADDEEEISVTPLKKDVLLDIFAVAWMPYYLVQVEEETMEIPGYGSV